MMTYWARLTKLVCIHYQDSFDVKYCKLCPKGNDLFSCAYTTIGICAKPFSSQIATSCTVCAAENLLKMVDSV